LFLVLNALGTGHAYDTASPAGANRWKLSEFRMNAYRLLRHPLNAARIAVLAGLSIGLCAQQAVAADEELVVSGAEVVAQIRAERELLQAEMQEYLRVANRELREAFDATLTKPKTAPRLLLSTVEISTRG
jgi:hypothetical protein